MNQSEGDISPDAIVGMRDEDLLERMLSVAVEASMHPERWQTLFQQNSVHKVVLLHAASQISGYPVKDPLTTPSTVMASRLSPSVARRYGVLLMGWETQRMLVAAVNPFLPNLADDLSLLFDAPVDLYICDPRKVDQLIETLYPVSEDVRLPFAPEVGQLQASPEPTDLDAPVVGLVNQWLAQAIQDGASDIHFEPYQETFRVRFRVDGSLRELPETPKALAIPVCSRLKVLADLDVAETRLPQDGRLRWKAEGRSVDLRVSTLPTQFGESIVLRVLDPALNHLRLDSLGMPEDVLTGVQQVAAYPHGIFIATGPTGCGKTTTLYSMLREINRDEVKVLTAEDPVEYEVEGLVQTMIRPSLGLDFAVTLRAFLRHDPDIILVGEIRDEATAKVAVEASMTGHLVLSSLHTNDAVGAVARLIDLGVDAYLVASTLSGVLAQRLIRKLCVNCRMKQDDIYPFADHPEGCACCGWTGFRGRSGIFEWLQFNESLRASILAGADSSSLLTQALRGGLRTLRAEGNRLAINGVTSLSEVLRHTG